MLTGKFDEDNDEFVLLDVNPLSLGMATTRCTDSEDNDFIQN